ncbi:MAG: hypothetical protein GY865_14935, partial [candidate division Zixibacteria bacterium]|nr:hypothetical protein [candidate division Zixibacteria bacterium]
SSLMSQMDHNLDAIFESGRYRLSNLALRPVYKRPESMVYERQQSFDNCLKLFENAGKNVLEKYQNNLSLRLSRLELMSPLSILRRGYAVLKNVDTGETIRSVDELSKNDSLETILKDGSAIVRVEDLKKK